jgi:hypothetical protein
MFRTATAEAVSPLTADEPAAGLIPVSHLELDLPAPVAGWGAALIERGIEVTVDDVGRPAISRADARQLFDEHREAEDRKREVVERQEQRAIEQDRAFRAQLWGGVPADHLPVGATPASVMLAAAKDSLPRRQTPLQHALANSGELTYHPLPQDGE